MFMVSSLLNEIYSSLPHTMKFIIPVGRICFKMIHQYVCILCNQSSCMKAAYIDQEKMRIPGFSKFKVEFHTIHIFPNFLTVSMYTCEMHYRLDKK